MQEYIEVEFRTGRTGYYPNMKNLPIHPEDLIIVEVERGEDIAQIVHMAASREPSDRRNTPSRNFRIKRAANISDLDKLRNIGGEEDKASNTFNDVLSRYPFEMKLIETVYQFDGNKLTFFFTADGRIDFRTFVRELAMIFKTRIELHQTSGRDEAKRLGGFGMCGNPYCCSSFLKRFSQVTIKMAKDQNLAGNLSKISGPCGRLLCCLNFEEEFYIEAGKNYPIIGTYVNYKGQKAMVFRLDVLSKKIYLSLDDQGVVNLSLAEFSKLKILSTPAIDRC